LDRFQVQPLPRAPVFLLVARLIADKGIREYCEAARILRRRHPEARFLLVGGPDRNPASIPITEVARWHSNGDIEYLGELEDVRPALARSLVYVLPSYREGTPRTVLEAMAAGRAIITADSPGCRETVIEGENGFLVPVKSVDSLVEAMGRFIQDPALAVRMGARSREIVVEKYEVHKVNAVMLRAIGITDAVTTAEAVK
jgi:glycosyltransferase involved in cell wall biosynthesis